VLGEGGMGVVVAARHLQLDERVAIKFMLPHMLADTEAVARFAREARAAVRIKSEHVARVSDVGVLDNGAPYLVMEYLDGSDLSAWLQQQGRLPIEQAVEFVLQASEALAEAHALGIVHRDLKPANLFIIRRPDGVLSVKVLDFGISKLTSQSGSPVDFDMTKTNAVMGSPNYMSPEQMRSSKEVDPRSDIWALGVILYELLAGQTPFVAGTFADLVLKVATEAPPPLRDRTPNAPLGLQDVISKCLEKDPGRRYATIGELAAALVPFGPRRGRVSVERISGVLRAAGMSPTALALPPSSDQRIPVDGGTAASWGKTAPTRSSSGRTLLIGAVVLTLCTLGLIGNALRSHSAPAVSSSGTSPPSHSSPPLQPPTSPSSVDFRVEVPSAEPPSEAVTVTPIPSASTIRSSPEGAEAMPSPSARRPATGPQSNTAKLPPPTPLGPKPPPSPSRAMAPASPQPVSPANPAPVHPHSVFDDR